MGKRGGRKTAFLEAGENSERRRLEGLVSTRELGVYSPPSRSKKET